MKTGEQDWVELGEAKAIKGRPRTIRAALDGGSLIVYIPAALLAEFLGTASAVKRVRVRFRGSPPTLNVEPTEDGGVALIQMKLSGRFRCALPEYEGFVSRKTVSMPCASPKRGIILLPDFKSADSALPRRKRKAATTAATAASNANVLDTIDTLVPRREKQILGLARMDALQVEKLHRAGIKPVEIAKQLALEEPRVRKHLGLAP